jgi:RNA:NAD 2'-phosphotransferase (TPT1/KptA family)
MVQQKIVGRGYGPKLILRHKPETSGLSLGMGGQACFDELIAAANRAGLPVDQALL